MKRTIVVIAGILAVLGPGAIYSFSLLSGPVAAAFGWSPTEVTWAFAMANFFLAMGAFVGGVISDRWGPRVVSLIGVLLWSIGYAGCGLLTQSRNIEVFYLCYGVIAGLGCGMTYIAVLSAVIRWFPNNRGFGGGLLVMGFGLGSFFYNAIVKSCEPHGGDPELHIGPGCCGQRARTVRSDFLYAATEQRRQFDVHFLDLRRSVRVARSRCVAAARDAARGRSGLRRPI
jgi:hypothetical protein